MKENAQRLLACGAGLPLCGQAAAGDPEELPLVREGAAACSVVAVTTRRPSLLLRRAVAALQGTVRKWSGVDLPAHYLRDGRLPKGPAIVLATLEGLRRAAPEVERANGVLGRAGFLDDQGFSCALVPDPDGPRVFLVSRTDRGLYNGAAYLAELRIDGPAGGLALQAGALARTPWLGGRAVYTLSIWGNEAEYRAQDWEVIFDSFARAGVDRVYFWASGHFPSKRFPQTYRCRDGEWDTTEKSRIGTVADLRRIVRYGHRLGMRVYLGGGLGGWCGTRFLTAGQPGTYKEGAGVASQSLCPSHPVSRRALIDYYKEMIDALPEADGLYIEMADEYGACECPRCRVPVDALGSRQYGQSQISLIQELAREVARDHPRVRFAITLGYAEHQQDPAFYEVVRQMSDARFEYMEARDTWTFPGPGGAAVAAPSVSRQVMHWKIYEAAPLEQLVHDANRVAAEGSYGLIGDFSPGFDSGSFYADIPFPTGILPYALNRFAFREATWEPTLTVEQMHERIQAGFFGREAPKELARDLCTLREFIRARARLTPEERRELDAIERRLESAHPGASPKTLQGLALMRRAIDDLRSHLAPPG